MAVAVALLAALAGPATAGSAGDSVSVLIAYDERPGAGAIARLREHGATIRFRYGLVAAVAADLPRAAVAAIRRQPGVRHVELDGVVRAFDHGPNTGDHEYENAWGVEHIGVPAVHRAGVTGTGVRVGVIDTGIDYVHDDPDDQPYVVDPEFLGNYRGGVDLYNNDADPFDDNGHGTHVAGILAAEKNGYLVSGVAPGVDLFAIKVLGAGGQGQYSHLIAGLEWAVANGMDVVNMSLGGHTPSDTLAAAVTAAAEAGVLLVAASGNVNPNDWRELFYGCPVAYPAAYPEVLATTFTNPDDALTGYSCTGPEVDVAAPGDRIFSPVPVGSCTFCSPYGYASLSGTSMASPHVAGLVALLLDAGLGDPDANGHADDVRAAICSAADPGFGVLTTPIPTTDPRYPTYFGCGVIDADGAVLSLAPPANRSPIAADDGAETLEDVPVAIAALGNDADPDGDPLVLGSVGAATAGTATANADGTITYTPPVDWSGTASFDYTVSDGELSDTGTVTVIVGPVDDPPSATGASATTAAGASIAVTLPGADPDTCELTFTIAALPANGGVGGLASQACVPAGTGGTDTATVTYTPAAGFSGTDSFTYRVSDGTTTSAPATVTIEVTPPPPTHHVGDLDGSSSSQAKSWTATVTVRIDTDAHGPASGAVVNGTWTGAASATGTCTTGATGTCTVTRTGLSKKRATITFTVTSVTRSGSTYAAESNHDPDGSSTGTSIEVRRV